jgi:hypothetical protein
LQIDSTHAPCNHITFDGCTLTGNGNKNYQRGGFFIEHSGTSYITAVRCNSSNNLAGGNQCGFTLTDGVSHCVVTDCVANNNYGYGFIYDSVGTACTYSGNTGSGNTSSLVHNDGSALAN